MQSNATSTSTTPTTADQTEHLRLAMILDQMPVGIGVFDCTGSLFHSNRHFERAAGGSLPSIHAMKEQHWRPVPADGSTIETAAYPGQRALNGDIATPGLDFVRQTSDGRDHWVSVSAVPLTGPNSTAIVGVVVVVEEAEAKRQVAERLRAKDERFRSFAKYSSNALWIADRIGGRITFLSPAAASIWTDLIEGDAMDALADIIHPDDLPRTIDARSEVARGHVQRFDYRIVNADGKVVRHLRETSFPIPDEFGEGHCIGGIVEDVSPEKQIYFVHNEKGPIGLLDRISRQAHRIKTFDCQDELMRLADLLTPGCVILDLRGSAADPDAIDALLALRPADLQVVLIGTEQTPVPHVVRAMRAGAIDYLVEPIDDGALEDAIARACCALEPASPVCPVDVAAPSRLRSLPKREREVLEGLVAGGTNKSIARNLGISPRTVEVHRAHLMERLNAHSLSELLQIAHREEASLIA